MKKVPLKLVPLGENQTLDYQEQFVGMLRQPENKEGASYEELTKVVPVITKIENAEQAKGYVLLEDAEHKILTDKVKNQKFMLITDFILAMIEDVINAPEFQVEDGDKQAAH